MGKIRMQFVAEKRATYTISIIVLNSMMVREGIVTYIRRDLLIDYIALLVELIFVTKLELVRSHTYIVVRQVYIIYVNIKDYENLTQTTPQRLEEHIIYGVLWYGRGQGNSHAKLAPARTKDKAL